MFNIFKSKKAVSTETNNSKGETTMTTVQTELFDATVGTEMVIPALIATSPEVTKAEEVARKVIDKMKVSGINLKDQAQVTAFVLANKEEISKMSKEEVAEVVVPVVAHPELAGPMHDELVKLVAAGKVFTDIGFEIAMNTFAEKSDDHYAFVDLTYITFEEELSDIADYFCKYMGVTSTLSSHARMAVYATADLSRTTGDLVEAGVTKTIQAVNKYVFQLLAKGIEAPIGGRPEALGKTNIVNNAAVKTWDRVKPAKKEVTPEVKA
jgi:hypothetical protein